MTTSRTLVFLAAAVCVALGASQVHADDTSAAKPDDFETMRQQLETVIQQNQQMEQELRSLRDEVETAKDEAAEAQARTRDLPPPRQTREDVLWSTGRMPTGARFQLMDISVDVLTAAGSSTARDDELELLQGGDHDPRRRGFNLQAIELGFSGAVDPYLDGQVNLVYWLDPEGESRFEIEEAFAVSRMLPFGLERHGLELKAGHFFTEFGRANHRHPHFWTWQDQPVILSRFFGEDGMRNPGIRAAWLMPLPWTSEVYLGMQNSQGETMVSFNANDEVFEERAIGGRPYNAQGTRTLQDFVYLVRWRNALDVSDTWSGEFGFSYLHGPNATGGGGRTNIYGGDFVFKWLPLISNRGFPSVTIEGEILYRDYKADGFTGCLEDDGAGTCLDFADLNSGHLHDWGGYAQVLWGFMRNWSTGFRVEYASGNNGGATEQARDTDPFRDTRWRLSPLLVWNATEFSRVRLQYNWDRSQFSRQSRNHTFWMGLEFMFGSHPAHRF